MCEKYFLHLESEAKSSYSGFWSRSKSLISVVGSETSKINWSESTGVSNFHIFMHIINGRKDRGEKRAN